MVKMKTNKLAAMFLAMIMTFAFGTYVPINATALQSRTDYFDRSYTLGSDPGQNMVNIAFAQKGKTGSQLNYSEAWCADFVSDCAKLAGQSGVIPHRAVVRDLAGAVNGYVIDLSKESPCVGDLCIFDWTSESGPYDHVEIVYQVSGGTVYTIGGNTGSTGNCRTNYVKTRNATATGQVQCYIHINYNGASNPPAQNNDDELGIPYPRPQVSSTVWLGKNGITSGDYVKWLQTALNKADNAGLAVDGQFGSGTTTAVKNFQAKHGLTQDGQAGIATINKLIEVIKGQMNPPKPPSAPDVSLRIDYDSGYLIFTRSKQENVERYKVEIGIVNGDVIVSNSNAIEDTYKWKFSQSDVSKEYYLKITAVNDSGSSSITKYFTILPQKPNLEAPNLSVDVNGQEVTFSWNLVANATHYDVRVYNSDGSSYENFWGGSDTQTSLSLTMPANKEFSVQVCAANKNYENCFTYCQPISFKTGIHKHEWGEWTIKKAVTCKEEGIEIRRCKECDENETRSIPATGHNWGDWEITIHNLTTHKLDFLL